MAWFKVDDKLHSHKKAVRAGEAMALWVIAGSWCADQLTDGFVPDYMVERLMPGGRDMAERLVAAQLWSPDAVDDEEGWRFNDWTEYQPTREEIDQKRHVWRRRAAMRIDSTLREELKQRDGDSCRYCGDTVNWKDRRSAKGGTYDHVIPVSHGGDESVDNLVVCCRDCNLRKSARTPEEAGMSLLEPSPTQTDLGTNKTSRPDPTRPDPENQDQTSSRKRSDRATRLPEGWEPAPEPELVAAVGGEQAALRELARFRDYWAGVGGQRGRKVDWQATWRNWLRKNVDDKGGKPRSSLIGTGGVAS